MIHAVTWHISTIILVFMFFFLTQVKVYLDIHLYFLPFLDGWERLKPEKEYYESKFLLYVF